VKIKYPAPGAEAGYFSGKKVCHNYKYTYPFPKKQAKSYCVQTSCGCLFCANGIPFWHMDGLKKTWQRIPGHVRKSIVLVVGMAFVIASPFTGVLPGPGGIPVFLIGVAILASEFHWAARLRDRILQLVHMAADHYRRNRREGIMVTILLIIAGVATMYILYTRIL
jgi:hypothetical protein